MGMAILCDGCGVDVASMDRASISMQSIVGGSVQVDLCWECASPLRRVPAVMEECRKRRDSILANQTLVSVEPPPLPPSPDVASVYPELAEEDAKQSAVQK